MPVDHANRTHFCSILEFFCLEPFGVLGKGLERGRDSRFQETKLLGPEPWSQSKQCGYCVVDPAGLDYIQRNTPSKAGGRSRAIYDHLHMTSFGERVRSEVKEEGDVAEARYVIPRKHLARRVK